MYIEEKEFYMNKTKAPIPPWIAIGIGTLAVSFSSIIIKWSNAPASILGMYRLFFTVCFMMPFLPSYAREIRNITKKDFLLIFISGLFLGLHFLFWIGSLKYTTVASSMIVTTLEPVFVLVGAIFYFRERTNSFEVMSMFVAIAGTMIVGWGDIGLSNQSLYGDGLSLLGTLAVSVYMIVGQQLRLRMSSFVYSISVFFIATLV